MFAVVRNWSRRRNFDSMKTLHSADDPSRSSDFIGIIKLFCDKIRIMKVVQSSVTKNLTTIAARYFPYIILKRTWTWIFFQSVISEVVVSIDQRKYYELKSRQKSKGIFHVLQPRYFRSPLYRTVEHPAAGDFE